MKDFSDSSEAKNAVCASCQLVVNHTSDQHWFKRARRSVASRARATNVWSDATKYLDTRIIFTDTEKSNWTWDPKPASSTAPVLLLSPT